MGGDSGLSYWSYARGFACANIINYEVVLASGEIMNANATTNKDVWIALKGGGNNFGVVTRFDFEAFPQGQLWGGKVFYFLPSFSGQVQNLVDYLRSPNPDLDVHICLSVGYATILGDIVCMNDIFSTKPEKPKALDPFADVQPQINEMKTLRVGSAKELTAVEFSGAAPNRVIKMSTTVRADTDILNHAVQVYQEAFSEIQDVANLLFSLTFESIPVSVIQASNKRGGNSLWLKASDGPLVVVLFYTSWDNAGDDDKIIASNRAALEKIDAEAYKKGIASPYRWLQYGYPHQDVMASYGSESLEQLRTISKKCDSDDFFQKAGTGLFKLWT
ncbi:FAD-dependent monooxygenase CTB5 [Paramyrothecium foliicola]|nr:FAD-dependent monooxygenase CTB5 [Paramyrothecium foliicola]